ncbi:hypothetical protein NDU88_000224 [Pleurodeles waltl]|uniref:Uncharacterized protein n=1 Tax=Pleurodeles waltl TaxID=8319 RepID=A0AAV7URJ7_PLEWA|nr:hypothetical protein NDU88_000224 [Pleurodeles waltl]
MDEVAAGRGEEELISPETGASCQVATQKEKRQHDANVTTPEGPYNTTPPPEEAHSDDSSSAPLDLDDQPRPSWASGQSVPLAQPQPNTQRA